MGSGERMASSDRNSSVSGGASVTASVRGTASNLVGGSSTGSIVAGGSSAAPRSNVSGRGAASPGVVRLFTDRAPLERRLRAELERYGFALEIALPTTFPDAVETRSVVVIDAGASSYDADEVLAHVGLARALGATPVVVLPTPNGERAGGIHDIDELVDDLCGGLVLRTDADLPRIAGALIRRASGLSSARFEYLTVSPRLQRASRRASSSHSSAGSLSSAGSHSSNGSISAAGSIAAGSSGAEADAATTAPLLAIFADTSCAFVDRPVTLDDDGSDVVAITISEDAESARIELASGRELSLTAGEAWTRSVRTVPEGRNLSAAEILAQIDGPTLGGRIRTLRLGAGLTQAELARRTGIHRPNIARVEAGRHTPSLETIARLAAAIGVPATRVLEG